MNVVSIVYGRADYVALQRLACKAVFPEHTFLVAAHSDAPARARMPIDIDLAYQTSATWPQVYVEAVEQVRQRFQQDDLLVMESDIVPLAGAARLLSNSFAREYGAREYSGVRFFKQGASAPVLLPWAFVYDRADDPLQKLSAPFREEYIGGDAFLHFNAGDKPAPSGHQHLLFKHLCQVYQVEIQPLEAHEYRIAFTAPGQESEGEALAYAQWLAQQPRKPLPPPPPPGQLLVNFVKAVGGRAKATLAGEPVNVSDEVFRQRVAICESCIMFIVVQRRCRHPKCGCWIDRGPQKARWATQDCPEGCWKDPTRVQALRQEYADPAQLAAMEQALSPAPPPAPQEVPVRRGCCGGKKA